MKTKVILFASLFLIISFLPERITRARKANIKGAAAELAAPLPDLAIQKVSVNGKVVTVRIKNIGGAASEPCTLAVTLLKGKSANSQKVHAWSLAVPAMAVNRDIALSINLGDESASGKGIVAMVDVGNALTESNKTNNKYFIIAPQEFVVQADLAAQKVYISDPTNEIIGVVKNVGGVKYSGSREARLICITIIGSHQTNDTLKTIVIPPLNPGQTLTIKGTKPNYKKVIKYKLRVEIDEGDYNPDNDTLQNVVTKIDNN